MGHKYTQEELIFLKEYAPGHSVCTITEVINQMFNLELSMTQVKSCMTRYGIKTGKDCRFQKGHVPVNKGTHPPSVGRMVQTQFKKGHLPHNWKPVGTISIRSDKRGIKYVFEKVEEPNVWKMKHILE